MSVDVNRFPLLAHLGFLVDEDLRREAKDLPGIALPELPPGSVQDFHVPSPRTTFLWQREIQGRYERHERLIGTLFGYPVVEQDHETFAEAMERIDEEKRQKTISEEHAKIQKRADMLHGLNEQERAFCRDALARSQDDDGNFWLILADYLEEQGLPEGVFKTMRGMKTVEEIKKRMVASNQLADARFKKCYTGALGERREHEEAAIYHRAAADSLRWVLNLAGPFTAIGDDNAPDTPSTEPDYPANKNTS